MDWTEPKRTRRLCTERITTSTDHSLLTLRTTLTRLCKWKNPAGDKISSGTDAMMFTQVGDKEEYNADGTALTIYGGGAKPNKDQSHIQCHDCGMFRHFQGKKVCTKPGARLFLPTAQGGAPPPANGDTPAP